MLEQAARDPRAGVIAFNCPKFINEQTLNDNPGNMDALVDGFPTVYQSPCSGTPPPCSFPGPSSHDGVFTMSAPLLRPEAIRPELLLAVVLVGIVAGSLAGLPGLRQLGA